MWNLDSQFQKSKICIRINGSLVALLNDVFLKNVCGFGIISIKAVQDRIDVRRSLSCEVERSSHICLSSILRREFGSKIPSWTAGRIRENGCDGAVAKSSKIKFKPMCLSEPAFSGLLSEARGTGLNAPFHESKNSPQVTHSESTLGSL
jgi:hypothetical protein